MLEQLQEEIAKELAFKHAKAYTVLYVGSTFKPKYSVKKGNDERVYCNATYLPW